MATAQKKKTEQTERPDEIVLINGGHGRKYVPYGSVASGEGKVPLGIPGKGTKGVATLHLIHPGINGPISSERFDQLKGNQKFKTWLEDQSVRVLTQPISEMNPDSCAPLLSRSSDVEGLKFWLEHETRDTWKDKLREMIMKMEKHAEKTSGRTGRSD